MRSWVRKLGLVLSAAAVLFTALVLPLHHHEEDVASRGPAHCSVCHFSKEGKTGPAAATVSGAPVAVVATPVVLRLSAPDLPRFAGPVSPRAPPSA